MRQPCTFKERDVKRLLRGVAAAGLVAISVVVSPDGTIKVDVAKDGTTVAGPNSWEATTA
jgi:hypothetical protein